MCLPLNKVLLSVCLFIVLAEIPLDCETPQQSHVFFCCFFMISLPNYIKVRGELALYRRSGDTLL